MYDIHSPEAATWYIRVMKASGTMSVTMRAVFLNAAHMSDAPFPSLFMEQTFKITRRRNNNKWYIYQAQSRDPSNPTVTMRFSQQVSIVETIYSYHGYPHLLWSRSHKLFSCHLKCPLLFFLSLFLPFTFKHLLFKYQPALCL